MIKQQIDGYKFGRGQTTGKFLTGVLAGHGLYFGDVELTRSFSAGDEFKRYTPESANKALSFQDFDGAEITGTIKFFQWNKAAKMIAAMGDENAVNQPASASITVTGKAAVGNVIVLEKFDVKDVVVSDGDAIEFDEGTHYVLHNDGDSYAVVTITALPAGVVAGDDVQVDFGCNQKQLKTNYLLANSKFEMEMMFQERVKADNPTKPVTAILHRVSIVLDGDISEIDTNAELKTVTGKFTVLADTTKPTGEQYGYLIQAA
jgi:ribosomal protein L14